MTNLNDLGEDYQLSHLEEGDINPNPVKQFEIWINEAISANVKDPNAMALATADAQGVVSNRMMLLKYFDDNGFVFFSNYESPKSQALSSHPQAALLFWWPKLERQVRIQGTVAKLDKKHSDLYFEKREKESNIASTLSKQSQILHDKQVFIDHFQQEKENLKNQNQIPRPDHWGGFILTPSNIEFWQGGPHRIHDRIAFEKDGASWQMNRLYP